MRFLHLRFATELSILTTSPETYQLNNLMQAVVRARQARLYLVVHNLEKCNQSLQVPSNYIGVPLARPNIAFYHTYCTSHVVYSSGDAAGSRERP